MPTALGVHIFAGGFSIGVEKHFDVLAHLERGKYGVKSWAAYRPNVPSIISDAGAWDTKPYEGKVDMVYGNPPCALWSSASAGYKLDHLFDWTRDVARVGKAVGAKVVVTESVRNAVRGAPKYRELAAEHGFSLAWVFVNARDHGLPQNRARLFFVMQPLEAGVFVPEFEERETPKILDVIGRALGAPYKGDDVAALPINARKSVYAIPGSNVHAVDMLKLLPHLPQGQRVNKLPKEILEQVTPDFAKYVASGRGWPGHLMTRLKEDEPCPVVYGLARYVHPKEDRLLTFRELMRIQGYPDDFLFEGDQANGLRMLGKTVCPPVGEYIAREVAAHLRGERDVEQSAEDAFAACSDPVRSLPAAAEAGATIDPDDDGSILSDAGDGLVVEIPLAPGEREGVAPSDEGSNPLDWYGAPAPVVAPAAAQAPQKPVTKTVKASTQRVSNGSPARLKVGPQLVTVTTIREEWRALSGPTALARLLIDEGAGDDTILSATGQVFGGRTEGPRLFTRKDLERLRARIAKKVSQPA